MVFVVVAFCMTERNLQSEKCMNQNERNNKVQRKKMFSFISREEKKTANKHNTAELKCS